VVAPTPGKTRITIRLDNDVIEHVEAIVDSAGVAAIYQTLINDALREYYLKKLCRSVDAQGRRGQGTPWQQRRLHHPPACRGCSDVG
jgi:hypothetical protein